MMKEFFL